MKAKGPDHPEGLEEAVEVGRKVFREGGYAREIVEAAAPAIRNQERQRIREALEILLDADPNMRLSEALDALEDSDA